MEGRPEWSMLWPDAESQKTYERAVNVTEACMVDLGLSEVAERLAEQGGEAAFTLERLVNVCNDPEVIAYRLDCCEDLWRLPGLAHDLEQWMPRLRRLEEDRRKKNADTHLPPWRKITSRLETLGLYMECIDALHTVLARWRPQLQSEAMRRLAAWLVAYVNGETFRTLRTELPKHRDQLRSMQSVTIGINLDDQMRPQEAVFLSVEPRPLKKQSLLAKLFGRSVDGEQDAMQGVTPYQRLTKGSGEQSAVVNLLYYELEGMFEAALAPIAAFVRQYTDEHAPFLFELERELRFYTSAVGVMRQLAEAGMAWCKPVIAPAVERVCRIEQSADPILAWKLRDKGADLAQTMVTNTISFDASGRVLVLTGPNQGGKTTYTRSIALSQLLFQAGLLVPGTTARISPADWVHTHFNEDEKPTIAYGRLGEESKRMADLFQRATSHSLLLLNESFSSTSPVESLYLCREVVKGLKLLGCRAVFATHHHELAAEVSALNASTDGDGTLISMVAEVEEMRREESGVTDWQRQEPSLHNGPQAKRTYRVVPGPPRGNSYAQDIANLYGIGFESISQTLRERRVIGQQGQDTKRG